MNIFARFDENPAMTLRVIKVTKRYGRTDGRTDNVKTVYPLQTKFAGGITTNKVCGGYNKCSRQAICINCGMPEHCASGQVKDLPNV